MSKKRAKPRMSMGNSTIPVASMQSQLRDIREGETTPITEHEGKKYLRMITSAHDMASIEVDVYCVAKAFNITCMAQAHALKKILCPGERGKGTRIDDLKGAIAALNRAIEIELES